MTEGLTTEIYCCGGNRASREAWLSLEERSILNIESVEKKLREAKFFLDKMIEHEQMAFKDKEPFEFYLSAFLSAGRTVDYRLRHEQKAIYPSWRIRWDATLTRAR
jgi:hypothetical protein